MLRQFLRFIRGLATNWVGLSGVVVTSTVFVLFLIFELLHLTGIMTSAFIGLVSYLALPAFFVAGLILIPLGWLLHRRRTGLTTTDLLSERFDEEWLQHKAVGSTLSLWVVGLTLVNLLFLGVGSIRMLKFMDEPSFCGTACHSVMSPEWAAYQESPHSRVKCVSCHVGQGVEALIDSKINGMWQMISVTLDLYERPIPTPVHNLRPSRETCEQCHWPQKFIGDRVQSFTSYDFDEASTPKYTMLKLKVGSGEGDNQGQIHWHVSAENEIRYSSTEFERQEMAWVKVKQADGSFKAFRNKELARNVKSEPERVMDCVDCHNRVTHIYDDPEDVVDRAITKGEIDHSLPFVKRAALGALTGSWSDREGAMRGIENDFGGFYRREYPNIATTKADAIDSAIEVLRASNRKSIHHRMNIDWNS